MLLVDLMISLLRQRVAKRYDIHLYSAINCTSILYFVVPIMIINLSKAFNMLYENEYEYNASFLCYIYEYIRLSLSK